ncbi:universal stress protein [Pelotalea chapellei]|uniref:Universal stress protein n=1 Tax=Pelotalea chapellei TaxID=44671 RepID=A0ABS5U3S5_9BACT|nr:universal stress protein [Pelotalea chapellei]MBT1070326.1 universal stress protein [Pelotalea chapellei]
MRQFTHILVINRLMANTTVALHEGIRLAKTFGADLSLLRIYSNPVAVDMEAVNAPGLFIKGEEYKNYMSVREQYKEELEKAIQQVEKDGIRIKKHLTDKEPVAEILRLVAEEHIDLIVALAHEEGGLEHLLFGGENDKIIRKMPCSVLLVKHEPKPVL